MHDLKFGQLLDFKIPEWPTLKTPACIERMERFRDHIQAVVGLKTLPGYSFSCGFQYGIGVEKSRQRLASVPDGNYKQKKIKKEAWEALMNAKMNGEEWDEYGLKMEKLMCCAEVGHRSFEQFVQSICILSWSAVENLLGDLLSGSIEAGLAVWNPIRGCKKWGVKKRELCLVSFENFFQDARITKAIKLDGFLALGAIRHLLVHKAGKIDDVFMGHVADSFLLKGLSPVPQLNATLLIDGKFTSRIVDSAIVACFSLLKAVDAWTAAKTS